MCAETIHLNTKLQHWRGSQTEKGRKSAPNLEFLSFIRLFLPGTHLATFPVRKPYVRLRMFQWLALMALRGQSRRRAVGGSGKPINLLCEVIMRPYTAFSRLRMSLLLWPRNSQGAYA